MLCSRNNSTVNKLYFKKFLLLVSKQNGLFGPVFVKKKKKKSSTISFRTYTYMERRLERHGPAAVSAP